MIILYSTQNKKYRRAIVTVIMLDLEVKLTVKNVILIIYLIWLRFRIVLVISSTLYFVHTKMNKNKMNKWYQS